MYQNIIVCLYFAIRENAVGPYGYGWMSKYNKSYIPDIHVHVEHYVDAVITPEVKTYNFIGEKKHGQLLNRYIDT